MRYLGLDLDALGAETQFLVEFHGSVDGSPKCPHKPVRLSDHVVQRAIVGNYGGRSDLEFIEEGHEVRCTIHMKRCTCPSGLKTTQPLLGHQPRIAGPQVGEGWRYSFAGGGDFSVPAARCHGLLHQRETVLESNSVGNDLGHQPLLRTGLPCFLFARLDQPLRTCQDEGESKHESADSD